MKRIPKSLRSAHASGQWHHGAAKKDPDKLPEPARPITLPKLKFLERDLLEEPLFKSSKIMKNQELEKTIPNVKGAAIT
jgi:hypothetical protein